MMGYPGGSMMVGDGVFAPALGFLFLAILFATLIVLILTIVYLLKKIKQR